MMCSAAAWKLSQILRHRHLPQEYMTGGAGCCSSVQHRWAAIGMFLPDTSAGCFMRATHMTKPLPHVCPVHTRLMPICRRAPIPTQAGAAGGGGGSQCDGACDSRRHLAGAGQQQLQQLLWECSGGQVHLHYCTTAMSMTALQHVQHTGDAMFMCKRTVVMCCVCLLPSTRGSPWPSSSRACSC